MPVTIRDTSPLRDWSTLKLYLQDLRAAAPSNQASVQSGQSERSLSRGSTDLTSTSSKIGNDCVVVVVRLRPMKPCAEGEPLFTAQDDHTLLEVDTHGSPVASWSFDHAPGFAQITQPHSQQVYGPEVSTRQVFNTLTVDKIIHGALAGYNGTIFAYGQTNSGKSHSLMGSEAAPGLIPLTVEYIFRRIAETHDTEYLVRVSYIEVFKERLRDLLSPSTSDGLRIVEDRIGTSVRGLREEVITSQSQMYDLIKLGERNRHYGATLMNDHSSRSHVLFRLVIESRVSTPGPRTSPVFQAGSFSTQIMPDGHTGGSWGILPIATPSSPREKWNQTNMPVRSACLYMVDLAGSERAKRSGLTGDGLRTGSSINLSLMTLGLVISKLAEGVRGVHIPYRDSILTRLLSTSLGGNAVTAMLSTISPEAVNREETYSTLRYASRAKKIQNQAQVNEITDGNCLLVNYRNEIELLKKQLLQAKQSQADERLVSEIQSQRQEDLRELDKAKAQLEHLQKLIIMSQTFEKASKSDADADLVNRKLVKSLNREVLEVAQGKRPVTSVYEKHLGVFERLQERRLYMSMSSNGGQISEEESLTEAGYIDELKEEVTTLQLQAARWKQLSERTETELSTTSSEITRLRRLRSEQEYVLQNLADEATRRAEIFREDRNILESQIAELQHELQTTQRALTGTKTGIERETESLLLQNKDLLLKIAQLNHVVEEKETGLTQAEARLHRMENICKQTVEDLEAKQKNSEEFSERYKEAESCRQELAEALATERRSKKSTAEIRDLLERHQVHIADWQAERRRLTAELQRAKDEIERRRLEKQTVRQLEAELEGARGRFREVESTMLRGQLELAEVKRQAQDLETKEQQAKQRVEDLSSKNDVLREQNLRLRSSLQLRPENVVSKEPRNILDIAQFRAVVAAASEILEAQAQQKIRFQDQETFNTLETMPSKQTTQEHEQTAFIKRLHKELSNEKIKREQLQERVYKQWAEADRAMILADELEFLSMKARKAEDACQLAPRTAEEEAMTKRNKGISQTLGTQGVQRTPNEQQATDTILHWEEHQHRAVIQDSQFSDSALSRLQRENISLLGKYQSLCRHCADLSCKIIGLSRRLEQLAERDREGQTPRSRLQDLEQSEVEEDEVEYNRSRLRERDPMSIPILPGKLSRTTLEKGGLQSLQRQDCATDDLKQGLKVQRDKTVLLTPRQALQEETIRTLEDDFYVRKQASRDNVSPDLSLQENSSQRETRSAIRGTHADFASE